MKLRQYICNKTTEVSEAGVIFEELPNRVDFYVPHTRIDKPDVGLYMDAKFVDSGWFDFLGEIDWTESKWFGEDIKEFIESEPHRIDTDLYQLDQQKKQIEEQQNALLKRKAELEQVDG